MTRKKYDHEAILKDWLAGMLSKELAAKYGCPSNLGAVLAKRHGVTRSPAVAKLASIRRGQLTAESVKASPSGKRLEKRNKRIADYAKRHDVKSAAVKFGLSEENVRIIARRYGWQPAPQLDRTAILADYLAGMKLIDIAAKYGCVQSYPSKLARLAGVSRYPQHRSDNGKGR